MPIDAAATASAPSLVTVPQATRIILSIAKRLSPVTVPLHDALGAILAEDIVAPEPLPPFPASIKVCDGCEIGYSSSWDSSSQLNFLAKNRLTWFMQDGYAVVAADGPGEYPVVAAARAGDDCSQLHLESGTVVYITTGGGIPASLLFLFVRISYSNEEVQKSLYTLY